MTWIVLLTGVVLIAGIIWWFFLAPASTATATTGASGVQELTIVVEGGYRPSELHVQAGRPVRLLFDRREDNPCSEEVVLSDFGIRRALAPHQKTVIELTPTQPGTFDFYCGMGMLHGKLMVSQEPRASSQ